MIVDDKPTFDDWFFHNEFDEKNVSFSTIKKVYRQSTEKYYFTL